MKRRGFLGTAVAAGAGSVALPGWLSTAFAQTGAPLADRDALVANAYRDAHRAGRALLVIIVPESDDEKYPVGHAWGELLNHGTDAQLWPLALVSVVAAPMAAVRRIVPTAPEGEMLAVLIETDRAPARAVGIDVELPTSEMWEAPAEMEWEARERWIEQNIDRRIVLLSGALAGAIAPNAAAVAARGRQVATRIPAAESDRIGQLLATGARIPGVLVERAAAVVAVTANEAGAARQTELYARLAAAARERIVAHPIRGARWATGFGCGVTIEGVSDDQQMMVACGMGHVPQRSARFLYFFTNGA